MKNTEFEKSLKQVREELAVKLYRVNIGGCGDRPPYHKDAAKLSFKQADRFIEVALKNREIPVGKITDSGGFDV